MSLARIAIVLCLLTDVLSSTIHASVLNWFSLLLIGVANGISNLTYSPQSYGKTSNGPFSCVEIESLLKPNMLALTPVSQHIVDSLNSNRICPKDNLCCNSHVEKLLSQKAMNELKVHLEKRISILKAVMFEERHNYIHHTTEAIILAYNETVATFQQSYGELFITINPNSSFVFNKLMKGVITKDDSQSILSLVTNFVAELLRISYIYYFSKVLNMVDESGNCMNKSYEYFQPFKNFPQWLGSSLAHSIEVSRIVLEAIDTGLYVLNQTTVLLLDEHCGEEMVKLKYCDKCLKIVSRSKPCQSYCRHVFDRCLSPIGVLTMPWNDYIMALDRMLVFLEEYSDSSIISAIKVFGVRLVQALLHNFKEGAALEKKVIQFCNSTENGNSMERIRINSLLLRLNSWNEEFTSLPSLHKILAELKKSLGYLSTLSEYICKNEEEFDSRDEHCWNGTQIGSYQINSEENVAINESPLVSTLKKRLHSATQNLLKQINSFPFDDIFFHDESDDGSGSDFYNNLDDEEGSGQGMYPKFTEKDLHIDDNDLFIEESTKPFHPFLVDTTSACTMNANYHSFLILWILFYVGKILLSM